MPGVLEEVQAEVLAEVHQEGDLPHQVVGQEGGHHQTTTMVSPDLLVQILGLSPRLVREDIDLLGRNCDSHMQGPGGMGDCFAAAYNSKVFVLKNNCIILLLCFVLGSVNLC